MRALIRFFLRVLAVAAGLAAVGIVWLYVDQRGLPDLSAMGAFAHPQRVLPRVGCLEGSPAVVSYESLGENLKKALSAAEASEDAPPFFLAPFRTGRWSGPSPATLVARRILCPTEKPLNRRVNEFRISLQLERRYAKTDRFAMMANTASFGDGITGVEAASERFFHMHTSELGLAEAALVAGMITDPTYYSPRRHADHALARRNQVIDLMLEKVSIRPDEAAAAKAAPLAVTAN